MEKIKKTKDIFSVKDKVVIITGGSGFLGGQYVKSFKEKGAFVVNWDVDTGVDISNEDSVDKAVKAIIKKYGRIDALINNAAFNPQVGENNTTENNWVPYESFPVSFWRRELDVNLTGQFIVTKAVVPYMMKRRYGSVIFISSDFAFMGPHNEIYGENRFKDITYIASKAGVLGLMRPWAAYLGKYNVRVNAFVPGGMFRNQSDEFVKANGELNMLGRMSREGEYNGPLIFLASDASIYMTGSCLVADAGRTAW